MTSSPHDESASSAEVVHPIGLLKILLGYMSKREPATEEYPCAKPTDPAAPAPEDMRTSPSQHS